jgi:nucleoside triphosphate pyrophosphatase
VADPGGAALEGTGTGPPELVLASASPRRARILGALGVRFRVLASAADESLRPGEDGAVAAERLARAKAETVAASVRPLPVLAADTVVLCGGEVLGKPESPQHAAAILKALAGRSHEVVTGVCLVAGDVARSGIERTVVELAPLSEGEVAWYVSTGEPLDKAGAYHVGGRGALFVVSISGSPSNVAGLPVRLVARLAREAGLSLGLP